MSKFFDFKHLLRCWILRPAPSIDQLRQLVAFEIFQIAKLGSIGWRDVRVILAIFERFNKSFSGWIATENHCCSCQAFRPCSLCQKSIERNGRTQWENTWAVKDHFINWLVNKPILQVLLFWKKFLSWFNDFLIFLFILFFFVFLRPQTELTFSSDEFVTSNKISYLENLFFPTLVCSSGRREIRVVRFLSWF